VIRADSLARDTGVPSNLRSEMISKLEKLRRACSDLQTPQSMRRLRDVIEPELRRGVSYDRLINQLRELRSDLMADLGSCYVVELPNKKLELLSELSLTWGRIFAMFPLCERDARDAVECYVVGMNTACVFHLMRTTEHGLRAVANDRRIKTIGTRPLELSEWGQIIGELEKSVQDIQQWKATLAREAAHEFYNYALKELRGFNDGWRRHVSHTRSHPYSDDETAALIGHVQRFMHKISERITHNTRTPQVWKSAKEGLKN
jgi:hypothetical protein